MQDAVEFFKILSDSTRLRILLLLNQRELCVCQMMGALGMPQPRVSQQLALLKRAGLVAPYRNGKWIYYRLSPTFHEQFPAGLALLAARLQGDQTVQTDTAALQACLKQQDATCRCDLSSFKGIRAQLETPGQAAI